jgi:hypothetical protein
VKARGRPASCRTSSTVDVLALRHPSNGTEGKAATKLPMKLPPTLLPTLGDEQRMVDSVAVWVETVSHRLEKEYSWEFLETELQKGLREGRLPLTIYAVQAADAGDEIADAVLRTVYAEMAGGMLPERRPGHLQIWAYGAARGAACAAQTPARASLAR